jgi:coenzyme Q-binding protein COQ10
MFDLVADVEQYPQFVPLCGALKIKNRTAKGTGVEVMIADMTVAYKLIRETFSSRVTLDRPRLKILVEYLDGPFRRMENRWAFRPVGEATNQPTCEVDFFIDYEFKSRVLAMLMGAMFEAAFRRFAAAFEARADAIYGK